MIPKNKIVKIKLYATTNKCCFDGKIGLCFISDHVQF